MVGENVAKIESQQHYSAVGGGSLQTTRKPMNRLLFEGGVMG